MIGIDTNILVYAYDSGSIFHNDARNLINRMISGGRVALADITLLEFYGIITDGSKVSRPLSPGEVSDIMDDIYDSETFHICQSNESLMRKAFKYAAENNILHNDIHSLTISLCLAGNGISKIYTDREKDFGRFEFIEALNPFITGIDKSPNEISSARKIKRIIPYGRQWVQEDDITAVCAVLRSDWLTTGPKLAEFEEAFARFTGAKEAVAVSNGTAALHTAMYALGIARDDEVIVPSMTFAASANCIVFQGGRPVFADVEPGTLLLDPDKVEEKITPRTKAVIAVDYTGQPCDYEKLKALAERHGLMLVDDACHALGGSYKGRSVGSLADLNTFSFHPVKHITTGEGGMITTDDSELASRMRIFRNHGITTDYRQRELKDSWFYEMLDLGYNYRITDFQCALGLSQLHKLPGWIKRRQEIARHYDDAFVEMPALRPLTRQCNTSHAYHLYVVQLDPDQLKVDRGVIFSALRGEGIGVNVHYIPVHLHPFYRRRFGTAPGLCPVAEAAYEKILSLPIFPSMSDADVETVISAMRRVIKMYSR